MDNGNNALVTELSTPLFQAKGWMKLVGVLMILLGVMYALTIFGIIIAWLPIWMGVLLFQAASNVEQANASGDQTALFTSLSKIKTYFTIMGILTLISVIMMVVGFFLGIGGAMLAETGAL
jgi:hypothetical protein